MSGEWTRGSSTGGDYEHGWQALRALAGRASAHLTYLRARRDFTPVGPGEMVLVEACPRCTDGGLRMAGYIALNHQWLSVRQCDTCRAVAVGLRFVAGTLNARAEIEYLNDRDDKEST